MGYLDTLSQEQKDNIAIITDEAKKAGITNPMAIAGMLAIISKESSFVPKAERDYSNTSNARIRKVFGSRVPASDSELNALKANPKAFFDQIYGGRYGNASDEGFKYRGRGLNQITFKGNYETYKDLTGIDIVSNPEKLMDVRVAAKVAAQFAKRNIGKLEEKGKLAVYNASNINDFKTTRDSTLAMYHANAGTGKSNNYILNMEKNDPYGGMTRALNRVNDLLTASASYTVEFVKKKPLLTVLITAAVVTSIFFIVKYSGLGKKNKVINKIVN